MTDDALTQYRDEYGDWITDHGVEFIDTDEGSDLARIDLPALNKAIDHLIVASKAEIAAALSCELDEILKDLGARAPIVNRMVTARAAIRHLRDTLDYVADPGQDETGSPPQAGPVGPSLAELVEDLERRVEALEEVTPALSDGLYQYCGDPQVHAAHEHTGGQFWCEGFLPAGAAPALPPVPVEPQHQHTLSCGCPVLLPVRMAPGRDVICSAHGPAAIAVWPGAR